MADRKVDIIESEIRKLFGDTSVSPDETRVRLEMLQDTINELLMTLEED